MSRTIGVAVDSRIKPSDDADTRSIGDFCPCMLVLSSNRLARLDATLTLFMTNIVDLASKMYIYIYTYPKK